MNFFPLLPFTVSHSEVAMYLMKLTENAHVSTSHQGTTNIMFGFTTDESKKTKVIGNFVQMLLDMQLFLVKKENRRVIKCTFI